MNMREGNTQFVKRAIHVITSKSGSTQTQAVYCLVRRKATTFFKDIKVLPSLSLTQHKPLVREFKTKNPKRQREKNCTQEKPYGNYMNTL